MEVLMVKPYTDTYGKVENKAHELIVKITGAELAQICGLPGYNSHAEKLLERGETTLNIGTIYKEAKEIVDAVPDIMTAIRTINSGAGKLEKVLEAKEED